MYVIFLIGLVESPFRHRWPCFEQVIVLDSRLVLMLSWRFFALYWCQSSSGSLAARKLIIYYPFANFLYLNAVLRIWIPDPDPHVFGPPGSGTISQRYGSGSGSFYHHAKIVRKTLIPTISFTFFDCFIGMLGFFSFLDPDPPSQIDPDFQRGLFCWLVPYVAGWLCWWRSWCLWPSFSRTPSSSTCRWSSSFPTWRTGSSLQFCSSSTRDCLHLWLNN